MPKIADKELLHKNSYQRRIVKLQRELDAIRHYDMIIGDFRISKQHPSKRVWIEVNGDGEGMECTEQALSDAIGEFYKKNF